jgi:hypothetical protein
MERGVILKTSFLYENLDKNWNLAKEFRTVIYHQIGEYRCRGKSFVTLGRD